MRSHQLSFGLGSLVAIGAFVAEYFEKKKPFHLRFAVGFGKLKIDIPMLMFIGALILGIIGAVEYSRFLDAKKKRKY